MTSTVLSADGLTKRYGKFVAADQLSQTVRDGAIYPIQQVTMLSLHGHAVGPYDVQPPKHAVTALGKVLTLDSSLGDVRFELAALVLLSLAYFALGVRLFDRRRMPPT